MQDRQHSSVPHRIQERDALPRTFERPGFGLPIADNGDRQQFRIVHDRSKGVHQHISELTAFVNGSRRGDRDMAGDTSRCGELPEQSQHARPVLTNVGIDLAVGAFEPTGRYQRGTAMTGTSHIDRRLVGEGDDSRHMRVYERKPWAGAPVAEKSRLDVICNEWPFEQRIVLEIDLTDRQVVAGSPPRVNGGQLAIGQQSKVISR